MYAEPIILPLDINGRIYTIQDEKGNTVGSGTREICEILVHLLKKKFAPAMTADLLTKTPVRTNIRAAIVI
jgi:hypothetical protein